MRLIHVADLHLGKTLHERSLRDEQAAMLDDLLAKLASVRPAALLVAGDIYDRSIPPPDAIELFDSFLNRAAAADPGLVIVAIPGNHDSAARLSFGSGLLSRAGVHLRTRPSEADVPVLVERGGERCAIWPIPYLYPGSELPRREIRDGARRVEGGDPGLRSQSDLLAETVAAVHERLAPNAYNVALAHCFAAGGAASESERAFVGLAEQVDASLFDRFDYAALGHLHRSQAVGAKARYAGSPMAYSFGECGEERGFLSVELSAEGSATELLAHRPLRRLSRLSGLFEALAAPGAFSGSREDYVEIRLEDLVPVIDPAEPLKANFPYLASVRQAAFELAAPGAAGRPAPDSPAVASTGPKAVFEDFHAFHLDMRGIPPDEAAATLFAEILAEAELETA